INPLMLRVGILNSPIRGHFVCVDRFRIWRGVIVDKLVKHGLSGVRNNLKANLAFALDGSDSDSFVPFVAASHSTHLPADVGFVYFDHSAQKLAVNLAHGSADSVTEIPSRLVRHVKRALDLQRRHALFGFSHQVDRKEPFGQGKVRVVEDRAACYRKLVATSIAVILRALRDCRNTLRLAARTSNAFRPAKLSQPRTAFLIVAKL